MSCRATARPKDSGIDILVDHETHGNVNVQVKHTNKKVGVKILRALIGTIATISGTIALLVTSSRFTRGVKNEQALAIQKGFTVELVDGDGFLAALNLAVRRSPPTIEEVFSLATSIVEIIYEETVR